MKRTRVGDYPGDRPGVCAILIVVTGGRVQRLYPANGTAMT